LREVTVLRRFILLLCAGFLLVTVANAEGLQDTQHNPVSLTKLSGKWVVVSYFAVWCGACEQEVPELNHFYEANKENNIVVYGVDFDNDSSEQITAAAQHMGIKYPVLVDNPKMAWRLDTVTVLPTTFIINPEGKVVETIMGAHNESYIMGRLNAYRNQ
jgi:peroxiredoxin